MGTIKPLKKRLQRAFLTYFDPICPVYIGKLIYRQWVTVNHPLALPQRSWLSQAQRFSFYLAKSRVQAYQVGKPPWVLLLHGWAGHSAQFDVLVAQLQQAGLGVLAFDAPGHGESDGDATNLLEIVDCIKNISSSYGNIYAVIGHSYGGVCALYAAVNEISVKKIVCIATPTRLDLYVNHYLQTIGVGFQAKREFEKLINRRLHKNWWQQISPIKNADVVSAQGLIVHDKKDRVVPWQDGAALSNAWPGSEMIVTENLGHSRILTNEKLTSQILMWLKD